MGLFGIELTTELPAILRAVEEKRFSYKIEPGVPIPGWVLEWLYARLDEGSCRDFRSRPGQFADLVDRFFEAREQAELEEWIRNTRDRQSGEGSGGQVVEPS